MTTPAGEVRPNQMGKRYECPECGVQVMCIRSSAGAGRVSCHGQPMVMQTAKPLPSSD